MYEFMAGGSFKDFKLQSVLMISAHGMNDK
jgi:hypothetical protein